MFLFVCCVFPSALPGGSGGFPARFKKVFAGRLRLVHSSISAHPHLAPAQTSNLESQGTSFFGSVVEGVFIAKAFSCITGDLGVSPCQVETVCWFRKDPAGGGEAKTSRCVCKTRECRWSVTTSIPEVLFGGRGHRPSTKDGSTPPSAALAKGHTLAAPGTHEAYGVASASPWKPGFCLRRPECLR